MQAHQQPIWEVVCRFAALFSAADTFCSVNHFAKLHNREVVQELVLVSKLFQLGCPLFQNACIFFSFRFQVESVSTCPRCYTASARCSSSAAAAAAAGSCLWRNIVFDSFDFQEVLVARDSQVNQPSCNLFAVVQNPAELIHALVFSHGREQGHFRLHFSELFAREGPLFGLLRLLVRWDNAAHNFVHHQVCICFFWKLDNKSPFFQDGTQIFLHTCVNVAANIVKQLFQIFKVFKATFHFYSKPFTWNPARFNQLQHGRFRTRVFLVSCTLLPLCCQAQHSIQAFPNLDQVRHGIVQRCVVFCQRPSNFAKVLKHFLVPNSWLIKECNQRFLHASFVLLASCFQRPNILDHGDGPHLRIQNAVFKDGESLCQL